MAGRTKKSRRGSDKATDVVSLTAFFGFLLGFGYASSLQGRLFSGLIGATVAVGAAIAVRFFWSRRNRQAPPQDSRQPVEPSYVPSEAARELERANESADLYPIWKGEPRQAATSSRVPTNVWSFDLLKMLEWHRFEQLCAGYLEALGFRARLTPHGADGGVDIQVFAEGAKRPSILVQCKAWNVYKVGVKPVRELFGVMAAEGVGEGIFFTTGVFTQEARDFCNGKNLRLIDGDDLLEKITDLPAAQIEEMLKLATEGDFTTPTCPSCGVKMIERHSKTDGERFWGCVNYPRCHGTLRALEIGQRRHLGQAG